MRLKEIKETIEKMTPDERIELGLQVFSMALFVVCIVVIFLLTSCSVKKHTIDTVVATDSVAVQKEIKQEDTKVVQIDTTKTTHEEIVMTTILFADPVIVDGVMSQPIYSIVREERRNTAIDNGIYLDVAKTNIESKTDSVAVAENNSYTEMKYEDIHKLAHVKWIIIGMSVVIMGIVLLIMQIKKK